jgi:hypothetical protein
MEFSTRIYAGALFQVLSEGVLILLVILEWLYFWTLDVLKMEKQYQFK